MQLWNIRAEFEKLEVLFNFVFCAECSRLLNYECPPPPSTIVSVRLLLCFCFVLLACFVSFLYVMLLLLSRVIVDCVFIAVYCLSLHL